MKKQAYLDAMGITIWNHRDTKDNHVVLTDDPASLPKSKLAMNVLSLMGYHISECRFVKSALSTDKVLWDLRLMNRPHKLGVLYSSPLNKLQNSPKDKSALWQQLWKTFELKGLNNASVNGVEKAVD